MEIKPQMTLESRINLSAAIPLKSPLVVYIEPTTYCNLACKFCPHHLSYDDFEHGNMQFELFKKIADDIKAFPQKLKLLRFCGLGDSLFNKEITKFVKYAADNQIADKIEMITNGLLLKEEHFKILSDNLTRLIVSVEGLDEADYMDYTKRAVNFTKFVDTLVAFSKVKDRKCKLHIKIHNSAVQTEEKLRRFHEIFSGIADELYVENLINLWPELISNLGINTGHRFDGSELQPQIACAQIFKSMQVNFDGKVMPCCIDWKTINVIGSVKDQTLIEIWNGKKIRELQRKHLQGRRFEFMPCAGCSMNEESDIDNIDKELLKIRERFELEVMK